ncbi:cobalamin biosynthesis protein CbiD [Anaeromyxobacter sp. Fw109-5]|nr:cobalamin biosynthesis protein CbiD [Anaeromyxobacter sp. Fw109-5]
MVNIGRHAPDRRRARRAALRQPPCRRPVAHASPYRAAREPRALRRRAGRAPGARSGGASDVAGTAHPRAGSARRRARGGVRHARARRSPDPSDHGLDAGGAGDALHRPEHDGLHRRRARQRRRPDAGIAAARRPERRRARLLGPGPKVGEGRAALDTGPGDGSGGRERSARGG